MRKVNNPQSKMHKRVGIKIISNNYTLSSSFGIEIFLKKKKKNQCNIWKAKMEDLGRRRGRNNKGAAGS